MNLNRLQTRAALYEVLRSCRPPRGLRQPQPCPAETLDDQPESAEARGNLRVSAPV